MKKSNESIVREKYMGLFKQFLESIGEDVGVFKSNGLNFPIVLDGDEGWVSVTISTPRTDDGYELREDYEIHKKNKAEEAEAKAKAKAEKSAKDAEKRSAKKDAETTSKAS